MRITIFFISILSILVLLTSCGFSSKIHDARETDPQVEIIEGRFLDSAVEGLSYISDIDGIERQTDSRGKFVCKQEGRVIFKIGKVILGNSKCNNIITPVRLVIPGKTYSDYDLLDSVDKNKVSVLLSVLQSLDSDGNAENGITITQKVSKIFEEKIELITDSGEEITLLYEQEDSSKISDALDSVVQEINSDPETSEVLKKTDSIEADSHFKDSTLDNIEKEVVKEEQSTELGYCKGMIDDDFWYNGQVEISKSTCLNIICPNTYQGYVNQANTSYIGDQFHCYFDSNKYIPTNNLLYSKDFPSASPPSSVETISEGYMIRQESNQYGLWLGGGNIYTNVRAGQSFTTVGSGYLDYIEVTMTAYADSSSAPTIYCDLTDANWNVLESSSAEGFSEGYKKIVRFNFSKNYFLNQQSEYRFTVYLKDTTDHYALNGFADLYDGGAMYDARESNGDLFEVKPWDAMFRVNIINK